MGKEHPRGERREIKRDGVFVLGQLQAAGARYVNLLKRLLNPWSSSFSTSHFFQRILKKYSSPQMSSVIQSRSPCLNDEPIAVLSPSSLLWKVHCGRLPGNIDTLLKPFAVDVNIYGWVLGDSDNGKKLFIKVS
jgi:hypothetical protein